MVGSAACVRRLPREHVSRKSWCTAIVVRHTLRMPSARAAHRPPVRRSILLSLAATVFVVFGASGCAAPDGPVDATDARADVEYPWHTDIVATTFWVGEIFDPDLPDGSQVCSTYDATWAENWSGRASARVPEDSPGCAGAPTGGCDGRAVFGGAAVGPRWILKCETGERLEDEDYFPAGRDPVENPFYLDVPYDDLNDEIGFEQRCDVIPWAADSDYADLCDADDFSFMKNRWVEIEGPNGETCYGQIQDAGPSHDDLYHDSDYVFGDNDVRPVQANFNNAGMDVSPALNACLGFADIDGDSDTVDWRFIETDDVPDGPWMRVVTSSGVTL